MRAPRAASTRASARSTSAPVVHLDDGRARRRVRRGARRRRPARRASSSCPCFLYGELARRPHAARSCCRGGPPSWRGGCAAGELQPDFGPRAAPAPPARRWSPRARRWSPSTSSSTAPATLEVARAHRRALREGGSEGLPGVRAIGLWLAGRNVAQVSTNVEDPAPCRSPPWSAAVRRHAPVGRRRAGGPGAARPRSTASPTTCPIPGFDPARHLIENAPRPRRLGL